MAELQTNVHLNNQKNKLVELLAAADQEKDEKLEVLKVKVALIADERKETEELKQSIESVIAEIKDFEEQMKQMCFNNGQTFINMVEILKDDAGTDDDDEELDALTAQLNGLIVAASPVKVATIENGIDSKTPRLSPNTNKKPVIQAISPLAINHPLPALSITPVNSSKQAPNPRSLTRFLSVQNYSEDYQRTPKTNHFQSPTASSTFIDQTISPRLQSTIDLRDFSPIQTHQSILSDRSSRMRERSKSATEACVTTNNSLRRQPRRAAAPVSLRELSIEEHAQILQRHFEMRKSSKK